VNVTESAVYEVELRIANGSTDGSFHFSIDGADISTPFYVQNTGSYQNWETLTIQNVILTPEDKKLRLHVDEGGFNVGSFTFNSVMLTTEVATDFFSATTLDESTVELVLNKPLLPDFIDLAAGIQFFINGTQVLLTDVTPSPDNPRKIIVGVDDTFVSSDVLKISYTGTQVSATDATLLENFWMLAIMQNIQLTWHRPVFTKLIIERLRMVRRVRFNYLVWMTMEILLCCKVLLFRKLAVGKLGRRLEKLLSSKLADKIFE